MIEQPELGKKISIVRKEKALTQEELAEACNISVRTVQRIESGEVAPRAYTVRLIFEALERSTRSSFLTRLEKENNSGLESKWPGQFYIKFIDLFNLKTNTMKKITILSIMISAVAVGIFTFSSNLNAQNAGKGTSLNESTKEKELYFSDFTCYGCMEEKGLMIGRDVTFTLSGVKVKNIQLIAIDKETRTFNALFATGRFLKHRVEIEYPRDMFIDGDLKYSADEVKESGSKISLTGNAKITDINEKEDPDDDESIEAEEIVITLE